MKKEAEQEKKEYFDNPNNMLWANDSEQDEYVQRKKYEHEKQIQESYWKNEQSEESLSKFVMMFSSPSMIKFASLHKNKMEFQQDNVTGEKFYTDKTGQLKIYIENIEDFQKGLTANEQKLFNWLRVLLTSQNAHRPKEPYQYNNQIIFSISDYCELLGLKNTKQNRYRVKKTVLSALNVLYGLGIKIKEYDHKNQQYLTDRMRILQRIKEVKPNIILVLFTEPITKYLCNSYLSAFNLEALKIDGRNQNAYFLYERLMSHYGMDSNAKKKTHNILSIKTLLEVCPDIPKEEDVKSRAGSYTERIIYPFEQALKLLENEKLIKWSYCNQKKEKINPDQIYSKEDRRVIMGDYEVFKGLYIRFELPGHEHNQENSNLISENLFPKYE